KNHPSQIVNLLRLVRPLLLPGVVQHRADSHADRLHQEKDQREARVGPAVKTSVLFPEPERTLVCFWLGLQIGDYPGRARESKWLPRIRLWDRHGILLLRRTPVGRPRSTGRTSWISEQTRALCVGS